MSDQKTIAIVSAIPQPWRGAIIQQQDKIEAQAAEIARLTEALADGSFYKESDIDALQDKIASLTEALAASEEARRAERAAVVRECAHTAYVACAETRHGILGDRCHAAICRLATDADNAALDKLLREARVVKKLEWSEPLTPMNSGCAYDNCTATVGKLEYRIEWKSWKQDAGYAVFLDDNYVADGGDTLEEAKTAAQDHLQSVADGILAALEAPQ